MLARPHSVLRTSGGCEGRRDAPRVRFSVDENGGGGIGGRRRPRRPRVEVGRAIPEC